MSSSSVYSRNTELRNVEAKDLYNLALILEDDNYWQQLMEIIPKEINNQAFATPSTDLERVSLESKVYERKYNNDHIRLIQSAILRPGESRLYSQILFDEWGSSGRKHERPTLGVLLHLLLQSKLYRAADFVAELLKESKPIRPTDGPAAEYEFEIDVVFNDIQDAVNDSRFYPNTEDLQENVNNDNKSSMNINRDYYTKYHEHKDKNLPNIKDNNTDVASTAPKPPPRSQKTARLLRKQQQQLELQQTANISGSANSIIPNCIELHSKSDNDDILISTTTTSSTNMPKLSALMNPANSENTTMNYSIVSDNSLPKLSLFENCSDSEYSSHSIPSLDGTKPHVVDGNSHHKQYVDLNNISTVIFNKPPNLDDITEDQIKSENDEQHHELPAISALNLNGERDDDEDDDDKNSLLTSKNFENVPSVALNYSGTNIKNNSYDDDSAESVIIPSMVANLQHDDINQIRHHLEAIEEDYNGIENEHENEHDEEGDFIEDDDENSLPNLSFLENRSSNNESSLTSVTNTSGENSFEQSVNDCSSTSTDNVPILSVLNQ